MRRRWVVYGQHGDCSAAGKGRWGVVTVIGVVGSLLSGGRKAVERWHLVVIVAVSRLLVRCLGQRL